MKLTKEQKENLNRISKGYSELKTLTKMYKKNKKEEIKILKGLNKLSKKFNVDLSYFI